MSLDRYAVLGNPVAHSRSPYIHAQFARQTGQAMEYGRLLCRPQAFADTVRRFAQQGGRGCNVTLPFKFEAAALASHCTARAQLAGAANVLRLDAAGWWADNTDGIGLVNDIERGAGLALAGKRLLLVGAGGASAGVLGPLLAARPAQVVVANRTLARAQALVERHAATASEYGSALAATGLVDAGEAYDLVLNASASSMQGTGAPVHPRVLAPGALAVDLMYGPAAEPFLAWARAGRAQARDGLGMLVEQAAEAFFFWRGVRPETTTVLAALRAEMAAAR